MSAEPINMAEETDEVEIREEEQRTSNLGHQALWVLIHVLVALGCWVATVLVISLSKVDNIPVLITTVIAFLVPFVAGIIFTRFRQNEMGSYTWLVGMIWFLIVCLWILDMPTGPNQCYHCDASQKIFLTFFSPYEDSGLIDGQGRFVGTWPALALIGYGIGSGFALKRKPA